MKIKLSLNFSPKFILLFLCLVTTVACQSEVKSLSYPKGYEKYPSAKVKINNQVIPVLVARTENAQSKGLSSVEDKQWPIHQGMLFYYPSSDIRSFWMPDTYFDLDIIYIDSRNKIVHIDQDIPSHPGKSEPPPIWRGKPHYSQHILELKAHHPYKIKVGDTLEIEL